MKRAYGSGSIVKVKGSDFLYILWRDSNGRQHKMSTKSTSKIDAEKMLRTRLAEVDKGIKNPDRRLRYEHLREVLLFDYQGKRARSLVRRRGVLTITGLNHLDSFFAETPVSKIDEDALRRFVATRVLAGAGASSINGSLALLRRMFYIAKRDRKVQSVPSFPMQGLPAARKGFVNPEQFRVLLAALPERLRPVVLFLYFTGCRKGEAKSIQWTQVDLQNHQVRLEPEQVKNSTARILPLPQEIMDYLRAVPVEQRTGAVFHAANLRKAWKRTVGRIFPNLLIHDLRRSAIKNLIHAGVPEKVCMAISGHKTREVFDRYHIVATEDLHRAMNRVQGVVRTVDARIESKTLALAPAAD